MAKVKLFSNLLENCYIVVDWLKRCFALLMSYGWLFVH